VDRARGVLRRTERILAVVSGFARPKECMAILVMALWGVRSLWPMRNGVAVCLVARIVGPHGPIGTES
jgi:hypothetical protein